jgi:hypothetical protein
VHWGEESVSYPFRSQVAKVEFKKRSEKYFERHTPTVDLAICRGQNEPKSTFSVGRRAALLVHPRLFGQFLYAVGCLEGQEATERTPPPTWESKVSSAALTVLR